MMRSKRAALAVAVLAPLSLLATLVPAGAGTTAHDSLPVESPSADTPRVDGGGYVTSIIEFGDRVLVAGRFTGAYSAGTSTLLSRPNIFVYGPGGVVDPDFAPDVNGEVTDAVAAPDGQSVYIVGRFSSVNGQAGTARVARIDIDTGAVITSFVSPAPDGVVNTAELLGDQLVIGGSFNFLGGRERNLLAALDGSSGAVLETIRHAFTGTHNGGTSLIKDVEVSPTGTHLVAIGNFNSVDGQTRNQLAVLDLAPDGSSTLDPFTAPIYAMECSSNFNTYMRDADISPDGSFFVVVTTGAYRGGAAAGVPCDTAIRWNFETGPGSTPVWMDYSGGDTLTAVEVAGDVIYVGGHQRWMNNPWAGDKAGPGAVVREGISAHDARNGLPWSWNPGRARGVGVYGMLASDRGLYVGSDTDFFNGQFRPRLAHVSLTGGTNLPDDHVESLPGNVYSLGQASDTDGSLSNNVVRRAFDGDDVNGASIEPLAGSWSNVRGAMMIDEAIFHGWSDGTFRRLDATSGTTTTVDLNGLNSSLNSQTNFASELTTIGSMFFDPVNARLYYTRTGSSRLFYRYFTPESQIIGAQRFTVPDASTIFNWANARGAFLDRGTLYFGNSSGNLSKVSWSNGAPVPGTLSQVSGPAIDGQSWTARGLFVHTIDTAPNTPPTAAIGTPVCTGATCQFDGRGSTDDDGTIESYSWDFGDGSPAGSGATVEHTYADPGTYTVTLTVTDDDGATGTASTEVTIEPAENQPPSASIATPTCTGLSCSFDGTGSSDPDGTVVSYSWDFGDGSPAATGATPTHDYAAAGTYTVALTVTDDDGATGTATRSVTVTEPANEPPSASIAAPSCTKLTCDFDGSGSTDDDGTIVSYSWDFDDGSADGTGSTVQHTFPASGTYTVTLTVTDDDGATGTDAVQVGVSDDEPEPSSIAFRGVSTASLNSTTASLDVPAGVEAGDALFLLLTYNRTSATYTQPFGTLTSWTQVDVRTGGSSTAVLWKAVAEGGDAGATVHVNVSETSKIGAQLLAYSGTDPVDPLGAFAATSETVEQAGHTTPEVPVTTTGSWLVSLWTDKTSTTTGWTAPAEATERAQTVGSGGGRVSTLSADSDAPVPTGTAGGLTATSSVSDNATMWSLVLVPDTGTSEPNDPPVANITEASCTDLDCQFGGSGSTDPDGSIVSYSWDFGDGSADGSGVSTSHSYASAGTYTVTLTVVDDDGASDTATTQVSVTAPGDPDPSAVAFRGVGSASGNSTTVTVDVPASVQPGDGLVLLVTYNRTSASFTQPFGTNAPWTQLAVRTGGSSTAVVWWAVAQAGDAEASVRVDLDAISKFGVQLLAYSGTDPRNPVGTFAAVEETVDRPDHTTPSVDVTVTGSWLLSLWTDKTSTTTSWTPPASATERAQTAGSGGGRVSTLSADSDAPVPTGTAGGLTATSTASDNATMWSIVLVPAP